MIALRKYEPGEVIIKENDTGDTAYILEKGRARVTRRLEGREIELGTVEAGQPFGEMSIIDEKPRSATVTAMEETLVREIHRRDFLGALQSDPDTAVAILKVLFERLREAHVKIFQAQASAKIPEPLPARAAEPVAAAKGVVTMEGLTPVARQGLPENPYVIPKFPFLIGRKSRDPLSYNDLRIPDSSPLQISRHHVELDRQDGRIAVTDRGSHLGAVVDGRLLGGREGPPGPIFLNSPEGTLILGNHKSPFRYKIRVEANT